MIKKHIHLVNCKDCRKSDCQLNGRDCDIECKEFVHKPMSRADQIRAMTDEQLARYLWIESGSMTAEAWLDWLRSEVQDG